MNKLALSQMSVQQLEAHIEKLGFVSQTESVYLRLKNSDDGKLLAKALRDEIEVTRNSYASIIPHETGAVTLLSGLQAEERILKSLVRRIADSENFGKEVDSEIKYALSLIAEKKQLTREQQ